MKEYIIEQKDSGQRVDKYLNRVMPAASKSFLYKMMRKKNIVINDKKIQGNEILNVNDSIKIWFSDETFEKFSNTDATIDIKTYLNAYEQLKGIEILYEDENFLILNKPAGILSQKAVDTDVSLNEWLIGYLINSKAVDKISLNSCKPSIVNRLDRNTSGIVLAGKTVYGLNKLSMLIKERLIGKYYLTYVWGQLKASDIMTAYHAKDNDNNIVQIIDDFKYNKLTNEQKNKYIKIQTAYKALKILKNNNQFITKAEVDLITGKSHQIRAHFASIGHALAGDEKYGVHELNKKFKLKYQLLHAYRVVFPDDESLNGLCGKEIICQPGNLEVFEARFLKN